MALETPKFMSKRLAEGGGEPIGKHARGRASSSNAEMDRLTEMITNVAKLALETKTELREAVAALPNIQTVLTPEAFPPSMVAVEQGKEFAKEAENKRGQKLNSPHVKIGMAFFLKLAAFEDIDKEFLGKLQQWWTKNVVGKEECEVEDIMPVFIAKKPQVPTKNWKKKADHNMEEEEEEESYIKIKLALKDVTFLEELIQELVRLGSRKGVGAAPKSKLERDVAKAIRRNLK
jgi:hypothetical protein